MFSLDSWYEDRYDRERDREIREDSRDDWAEEQAWDRIRLARDSQEEMDERRDRLVLYLIGIVGLAFFTGIVAGLLIGHVA